MRQLWLLAAQLGVGLAAGGAAALAAEIAAGSPSGAGLTMPGGVQLALLVVLAAGLALSVAGALRRRWWPAAILALPVLYAGALAGLIAGLWAWLAVLSVVAGSAVAVAGVRGVLRAPAPLHGPTPDGRRR